MQKYFRKGEVTESKAAGVWREFILLQHHKKSYVLCHAAYKETWPSEATAFDAEG